MGWYPVCDQGEKIPIIGWRYAMEGERLAIRWSNMRLIFQGVPSETVAKFAGHARASVYYRSHIKGKYPCIDQKKLISSELYKPTESLPEKNLKLPETKAITYDLFGQIEGMSGSPQKRRSKHSGGP